MWTLYLDFMRDMWPHIEDLRELESRFSDLNYQIPPLHSNYSAFLSAP